MKLNPFSKKQTAEEEAADKEVVDEKQKKEDEKDTATLEEMRKKLHTDLEHDEKKTEKILADFKGYEKKGGQDKHFAHSILLLIEMVEEIANKYALEFKHLKEWIVEATDKIEYEDSAQARKFLLKLKHQIEIRLKGIFGDFWAINHLLGMMLFYINRWYPRGAVERSADAVTGLVKTPGKIVSKAAQKVGLKKGDKRIKG